MFGSVFNKVARLGIQTTRRIGSTLSSHCVPHSNAGYAIALGTFGAVSIFLIKKHLDAQEEEGGFLYTW